MIKVLHLSDIHLGSGFSHGKINPQTGLNTRFEDFVAALSRCMDRATATGEYADQTPVDLVLFGGDAFPDATPAPYIQEAFARQFRRLVDAQIPAVLLVGNHDQHAQGQGGASLCLYRTLGIPGFVVGDRLQTHTLTTRNGPVQVITLPWLTRSTLLTRPESEGLSLIELNNLLLDRLRMALEGEFCQLDPTIPTVLLAHLMADTAFYGAERFLAVGKGITVPTTFLTRPCLDYVALGHVHRHQVLAKTPPVVYPGSIERVDFSEEKEEKGYVLVDLQPGHAQIEFCPLPVRPFYTIEVDLSAAADPQVTLTRAIARQPIQDAVVRLTYKLRPDQAQTLDSTELHLQLSTAHTYTIQPEFISQLTRPRLPELGRVGDLAPLEALQIYIANQTNLEDMSPALMTAAEALLAEQEQEAPLLDFSQDLPAEIQPTVNQLRLL